MSRKVTDISAERLAELHRGQAETTTLVESFALDFSELMRQALPQVPQPVLRQMRDAVALGIVARMRHAAALLLETCGTQAASRLALHPSDIVRGWVCYMIGLQPELTLAQRLADIRPLADDSHFGVREWAWLALRPHMVDQPEQALALLTPWTAETSARLRRYACEALRPRGVWCTHIALFKQQPQRALPL